MNDESNKNSEVEQESPKELKPATLGQLGLLVLMTVGVSLLVAMLSDGLYWYSGKEVRELLNPRDSEIAIKNLVWMLKLAGFTVLRYGGVLTPLAGVFLATEWAEHDLKVSASKVFWTFMVVLSCVPAWILMWFFDFH